MKGSITVIIGGQYGSEAKGKVASFMADEFDIAIRTGSPNAGHTVFDNDREYKLQQIPATFLNKNCILCIGAGSLIDPDVLMRETQKTGTADRIILDPQTGIILQQHKDEEGQKNLVGSIGSTGKGCGAALADRIWRKDFKLVKDVPELSRYQIRNVSEIVNDGLDRGKNILIEGTQGFGLSLYHGTYPYVTSRDTTAANFLAETGASPLAVKEIILVIRTYPIRVAGESGPLAKEITWEELSKRIGKDVTETTTVTGKTRRIGEFDMEAVKKAVSINRPTQIALQFLNYLYPADEGKTQWNDLSLPARAYIDGLETELGVPVTLIGTGKKNEEIIDRRP